MTDQTAPRYVGFWIRFLAAMIDSIWASLALFVVLAVIYQAEFSTSGFLQLSSDTPLEQFILYAVLIIAFWMVIASTPGKLVFNAYIVDADTLRPASNMQLVIRYFCYYISLIPLFLGFLWVAFDARKQGWHDKLARTVVIKGPIDHDRPDAA